MALTSNERIEFDKHLIKMYREKHLYQQLITNKMAKELSLHTRGKIFSDGNKYTLRIKKYGLGLVYLYLE